MSSVHASSSLVRLVTSLRAVFWSCVLSARSWWFIEWLAMILKRGIVYRTKRTGPSIEPWGTMYMSCDGEEDKLLTEADWYLSERIDWNHWSTVDWMPKTGRRGVFGGWQCQKLQKDQIKEEQRCCHCPEWREYRLQHVTKQSLCCILLDRLTERDCWGCFLGDRTEFCGEPLFQGFWTEMKARNGAVVFQKIFVKWWLFQKRFDDGCLQIMWYNASGH